MDGPVVTRTVSFASINCCGFQTKLENAVFDVWAAQFDFVVITETNTSFAVLDNSALAGFTPLNSDLRAPSLFAEKGIFVLVRDIFSDHVGQLQGCSKFVFWFLIGEEVFGRQCVGAATYLAHEGAGYHTEEMFDDISRDIVSFKARYIGVPFLLLGDFNARTGGLVDFSNGDGGYIERLYGIDDREDRVDEATLVELGIPVARANSDVGRPNSNGRRLVELCQEHGLIIANGRIGADAGIGRITCHNRNHGRSTVDYMIASPELFPLVSRFEVQDFCPLLSDVHCPVVASIDSRAPPPEVPLEEGGSSNRYKFYWDEDKKAGYQGSLSSADLYANLDEALRTVENHPSQEGVDGISSELAEAFVKAGVDCGALRNHTAPAGRSRLTPHKPWFDDECGRARTEFFRVKNRVSPLPDIERSAELRLASKAYKKVLRAKKLFHRRRVVNRLRNLRSSNSKEYWNLLNSATRSKKGSDMNTDSFVQHFKDLSSADTPPVPPQNFGEDAENEFLNQFFSEEEIRSLRDDLLLGKKGGLDWVRNEFLKCCPDEYIGLLTRLFNLVLSTGFVPAEWCIGSILPLYKGKGSRSNPDNYRGITLLSCIGKLFTAAINQRLQFFVERNNLLGEEQAGFRAEHSTLDHIFSLHMLIKLYQQRNRRIYAAFVDYKKAFDLVDRSLLWRKVMDIGVKGRVLKVVVSMYEFAKSCVTIDGRSSDSFICNIGVRQGENLSPLLFAIFLSDFKEFLADNFDGLVSLDNDIQGMADNEEFVALQRLFVLLYADDTILLAEDQQSLQRALNALFEYCERWKLTVNTVKTQVVVFSRGTVRLRPVFWYGGTQLKVVDHYVYLGVAFYSNGCFRRSIHQQVLLARGALNALLVKTSLLGLPVDLVLEIYEGTVLPVLLYGSEIWGFSDLKEVETFHTTSLKRFLAVGKATRDEFVFGETGSTDLKGVILKRMTNFWLSLANGRQSKFSVLLYNYARRRHCDPHDDFTSEWMSKIESGLTELGMEQVWLNRGRGYDSEAIKRSVSSRSVTLFDAVWNRDINVPDQHDFFNLYKLIKPGRGLSSYLDRLNFYEARALTRFVCRSNFFPCSDYRRYRDPLLDMSCRLCDREYGDEGHYIFRCPFLANARQALGFDFTQPAAGQDNERLASLLRTDNLGDLSRFARLCACALDLVEMHRHVM